MAGLEWITIAGFNTIFNKLCYRLPIFASSRMQHLAQRARYYESIRFSQDLRRLERMALPAYR